MKVERISYSESRESANTIGLKSWKKYSVDILLEEGDDKEEVSTCARSIVRKWLNEGIEVNPEYAHLLETPIVFEQFPAKTTVKSIADEKIEIALDNASTLEELAALKSQCTTPELMKHYMDKLKSISK